MRNLDPRPLQNQTARQDEIDVQRPRRLRIGAVPARLTLDGQQSMQQRIGSGSGEANHGGVQVPGLIDSVLGFGLQEGRDDETVEHGAQARGRQSQVRRAVAEVAAEADRDSARLAGGPWEEAQAVCFCLQSMQTRVQGMAFRRAGAIDSPQSRQTP